MKKFIIFFALLVIVCFVHAEYDLYAKRLEKSFREYHPDPHRIIWKKAENLTADEHRIGCMGVLSAIVKRPANYIYQSVPTCEIQSRRVIRDAPLQLQNETVKVTLVKCFYTEFQFYIIKADDSNVFNVFHEHSSGTFHLRSGPHEIYYEIERPK